MESENGLVRVNVMLTQAMLDELDKMAAEQGTSRSALLREAVSRLLSAGRVPRRQEGSLFPMASRRQMTFEEALEVSRKVAEKLKGWDGVASSFVLV